MYVELVQKGGKSPPLEEESGGTPVCITLWHISCFGLVDERRSGFTSFVTSTFIIDNHKAKSLQKEHLYIKLLVDLTTYRKTWPSQSRISNWEVPASRSREIGPKIQ